MYIRLVRLVPFTHLKRERHVARTGFGTFGRARPLLTYSCF